MPSTMPKRSASATREMTYTQERSHNRMNRDQSPVIPSGSSKSPPRNVNVKREYVMESSSSSSNQHMSRRDSPSEFSFAYF